MADNPWVGQTCENGHEDCDGSPMLCLTRETEALGLYEMEASERRAADSGSRGGAP